MQEMGSGVRSLVLLLLCATAGADLHTAEGEVVSSLFGPKSTYNKLVRPQGQRNANVSVLGEPVLVTVNMYIRHIDDISDDDKDFQLSMTLRQNWNDRRLRYTPSDASLKYVVLTQPELIWVPDLFFSNEKQGQFHDLLTRNALIRILPNGDVLYSARISGRFSCPMDFTNYPMDKQVCYLRMASYAHTTAELMPVWKHSEPLQVAPGIDLSPFRLLALGTDNCHSKTLTGQYGCLRVEFLVARTSLMHAYLPLGLLVVVSWLIFWLHERAMAVRVLVALLTLLATVAEGSRVSAATPHSGHAKAIDCWTSWTLFFVFLALLEQVAVLLTGTGGPTKDLDIEEANATMMPLVENCTEGSGTKGTSESADPTPSRGQGSIVQRWLSKYTSSSRRIDMVARVLFPLAFLVFNVAYWFSYGDHGALSRMTVANKFPYLH